MNKIPLKRSFIPSFLSMMNADSDFLRGKCGNGGQNIPWHDACENE
jgi:hypothetical protein